MRMCHRLRDGKLEQGVLREAASRLQQKIQKHLFDSEDKRELLLEEQNKNINLDHAKENTAAAKYQVKITLSEAFLPQCFKYSD